DPRQPAGGTAVSLEEPAPPDSHRRYAERSRRRPGGPIFPFAPAGFAARFRRVRSIARAGKPGGLSCPRRGIGAAVSGRFGNPASAPLDRFPARTEGDRILDRPAESPA